jgi:hypothetical protein
LLLPERRRFSGQKMTAPVATRLGRADIVEYAAPGEREQLLRHFDLLPRGWPMAALTRQFDAGDAGSSGWLRADPVFVRPDMHGARLMAWGNLELASDEAGQFIRPLLPLFGDAGFPISMGAAERWYVALPREINMPTFTAPHDGLGDDLLMHLPEGGDGRRWRMLLNEAQVILHNHPRNAERIAAGLLPVNSIWFWGGGALPDAVGCAADWVESSDVELLALARHAGLPVGHQETGSGLIDLRHARDWASVEREHLLSALDCLHGRYHSLLLDFADGSRLRTEYRHRWRFWRQPLAKLAW